MKSAIRPFEVCGWLIVPKGNEFQLHGGGVVVHEWTLEDAVRKAQSLPRKETRA